MKFTIVCTRLGYTTKETKASLWEFYEFDTVEKILPHLNDVKEKGRDAVVLVDQNLDSKGGILTGSDLIRALVDASVGGVIVSASGDDAIHHEHQRLGAHILWTKPLPKVDTIFEDLAATYGTFVLRDAIVAGAAEDNTRKASVDTDDSGLTLRLTNTTRRLDRLTSFLVNGHRSSLQDDL